MQRGIKKEMVALHYGELDEVRTLSDEERNYLRQRFMPNGVARRSIQDIAAEAGLSAKQVCSMIDHAVERIIAWYERQDHVMHEDDQTGDGMPYIVTDLGVAAALSAVGFTADLRPLDEKRVEFIFDRGVEARQCATEYWNNSMQIDAREYFDAVRNMKARIYDLKSKATVRDMVS